MRPTALVLKLLTAWLVLAVMACVWAQFVILWQIGGGLLLLVMVVDALTLPRRGRITGQRSVPGRFALGVASPVTLTVTHAARRALQLEVFDGIPTAATAEGLPHRAEGLALQFEHAFTQQGDVGWPGKAGDGVGRHA